MGMWKITLEESELDSVWSVSRPSLAIAISSTVWSFQLDTNYMGDLLIGIGEAVNDMVAQGGQSGSAKIGDMEMERGTITVAYCEGESNV